MTSRSRRARFESEVVDGVMVRFHEPILDESSSEMIRDELFDLVEESGKKQLHLDLTEVKFLSSAALGALIALQHKLDGIGGVLSLCNVNSEIEEVLRATKLDRVLRLRRT